MAEYICLVVAGIVFFFVYQKLFQKVLEDKDKHKAKAFTIFSWTVSMVALAYGILTRQ